MKSIPTVYELRKKGWKVRVGHHRKYFRYDTFTGKKQELLMLRVQHEEKEKESGQKWFLDARGGVTTITITIPEYDNDFTGVSECSDQEHYRRETGLKKSLARALSSWFEDTKNSGN